MEPRQLFGQHGYYYFPIAVFDLRFITDHKSRGFTLIELLVSMGIAAVVLAAISNTFISQNKFYNAQELVNEMQQNARAAIDLITREVKMAGYDPTGLAITANNGIPYSASELQILADLTGNQALTENDEDITYTYDSANLRIQRASGATTTTVADNIADFTFDYLDASGAATETTANIRQIEVSITARTSKPVPDSGHLTYQLTTLITPKNLCYKGGNCP